MFAVKSRYLRMKITDGPREVLNHALMRFLFDGKIHLCAKTFTKNYLQILFFFTFHDLIEDFQTIVRLLLQEPEMAVRLHCRFSSFKLLKFKKLITQENHTCHSQVLARAKF